MTIGIYCLRFEGTDKVYIGQSVNIELRYKAHKYNLKKGLANPKLIEAYTKYGEPELEIICECTLIELNDTEDEAILIFNAVDNGFNVHKTAHESPITGKGELHNNSKYSNEQIVKVFNYLIDNPEKLAKEIEVLTGVSISVIRQISGSILHLWLEEQFPEKYKILRSMVGTRDKGCAKSLKERGISYPKIQSPAGETYLVEHLTKFAHSNSLDPSALLRVLKGKANTHKGWKLA